MVTTEAGALLAQLVDGRLSVGQIAEMLTTEGVPVHKTFLEEFFNEARDSRLFEPPPPIPDLADHWRDRRLTAMHLHLTDKCNLACTYCLRGSSPEVAIRHRPKKFIDFFSYIAPFAAEEMEITFTGGEPLMYPGFSEVVEAASQHRFHNILFTNAILVTDERAQFIAQHFKRVQVSLDGADAAAHAETRGDNAAQVLRGIGRLSAAGAKVTVQVTISTHNLDSAKRVRDVLPDAVRLRFTPVMPHGRGTDVPELFLNEEQFLDFSRSVGQGDSTGQFEPGMQIRSCHAGLSNLSIADSGDVYPCHLFHSPEFWFGNVFHDRFDDIFFGDKIRDYVASMDVAANNPVCAGCEVRYLCGGGCKANAMAAAGDYRGVDMWCSYLKASIVDELFLGASRGTTSPVTFRRSAVDSTA